MMVGLSIYVAYHSRTRWGTHWNKYGPTYITILSGFLIMADLTRHVLEDTNVWPSVDGNWGAAEYRSDCTQETMHCLTTVGVLFTIVFTYSGFFLMAVGTMWNANICDKIKDIREEWRKLRGTSSK